MSGKKTIPLNSGVYYEINLTKSGFKSWFCMYMNNFMLWSEGKRTMKNVFKLQPPYPMKVVNMVNILFEECYEK